MDAIAGWAESQEEVAMTVSAGYDEWRMKVGYMRAGYLAVSALLGYRYILRSSLEPVRAQLSSYDADIMPPAAVIDHPLPKDRRTAFLLCDEPDFFLGALMVTIGDRAVFFPPPAAGSDWYERFDESLGTYDGRNGYTLVGRPRDWPADDPPYLSDQSEP